MIPTRTPAMVVTLLLVLAGCTRMKPIPEATHTEAATTPATFIDRVWTVAKSGAVAPGQLYVFLSEGTLVMASIHGTPSLGKWTKAGEDFTMVEEGISYKVDILELNRDRFRIRILSRGQPVVLDLVPAEGSSARPAG